MMNPSNQNDFPKADTYTCLEFQGWLSDVPTYDRDSGRLEFVARSSNHPSLKFFANGEIGLGFKNLLHKGAMVQIQAIPFPHLVKIDGKSYRILDWQAIRIQLLGVRKTNLGKFSDARILDGLMPAEGQIEDVGYIDPSWLASKTRQAEKGEKLLKEKEELDSEERKEGDSDDKSLQRPADSH